LKKINAVIRYTRGNALNGASGTFMAYRGTWNSSDQIPGRAVADGSLSRFGTVDDSSGGDASRYSGSFEWQRTRGSASTKLTAFGIAQHLDLFSNFTYFLDDPENGDQFRQADRRFTTGAKLTHRRIERWGRRLVQNTVGAQLRNDQIFDLGLFHTRERAVLNTVREDEVMQTSLSAYYQQPRQSRSGLPVHEPSAARGRRVQPVRFERQRYRILLPLASARRAARRRGRHPFPSDAEAHGQGQLDGGNVITCHVPY